MVDTSKKVTPFGAHFTKVLAFSYLLTFFSLSLLKAQGKSYTPMLNSLFNGDIWNKKLRSLI